MSKKQKPQKLSKELLAYLKRRWGDSPISAKAALFGVGATFAVLVIVLVIIWSLFGAELAKFIGYLIGGGLLVLQIYVSNRRATASEKTAEAMQTTTELTEKGNIDERFKNAIEHLGHESASTHLGGIYVLHHIAQEVDEYRERVFEILCAHIRETTAKDKYKKEMRESGQREPTQSEREDPTIEIQSILNLLFVKTPSRKIYKRFKANLEGADLKGAELIGANLIGADLRKAKLQKAELRKANLQKAKLHNADLYWADLYEADLREADLREAKLNDADLQKAKLHKVDLRRAHLIEINLQVEQLLKAKTLYKAKFSNKVVLDEKGQLEDGMEEIIRQRKPELLEKPDDEEDA